MIEITIRKFRLEEDDDGFLCESAIRQMPGYMELEREGNDITASFYKKVI